MNDPRKDRVLQELFGELRAEDSTKTPDFHAMMAQVRADIGGTEEAEASGVVNIHSRQSERSRAGARGIRTLRWTWLGGVLAAAVIATVMLVGRDEISDQGFEDLVNSFTSDPALGAWKSPTDALLELPGREIVTTVPRIGKPTLLGVPGLTGQSLTGTIGGVN